MTRTCTQARRRRTYRPRWSPRVTISTPAAITSAASQTQPLSRSAKSSQPQNMPDSETTLDGNSVVVEEQMLKMAESRMAYDAAISLYQKSMQMLRLAAKKPGG